LNLRDEIRGEKVKAPSRKHRERETGVQLIEFALVLPFLLVMLVGIIDFGLAWATKDKLADAARDGARVAVAEFNDTTNPSPSCGGTTPCSVQAAANTVVGSLNSSNVNTCSLTDASTLALSTETFTWTFSNASCLNPYTIKVERAVPLTVDGITALCTRVTVDYGYDLNLFHNVDPLLNLGSNLFSKTITLDSAATMTNSN